MIPEVKKSDLRLLDKTIELGGRARINLNTAKLYTNTVVEIPVIVERAKRQGPTVLITAGIHGDEINGVEIVRRIVAEGINRPKIGTIICIPVLNVFGFLKQTREFPDGRDLNRVFPGFKNGSLASQFAYRFVNEILPSVNFCMDFHTGGASRFNTAQIRVEKGNKELMKMAEIFGAPFTILSPQIPKSYRTTCAKLGKPILLFEGGKSLDINKEITETGINGAKRILAHFGMLRNDFSVEKSENETTIVENTKWLRARHSGMFHSKTSIGKLVKKGELLAEVGDPYGQISYRITAPNKGYIININHSPIVYQGDAIFHISTN